MGTTRNASASAATVQTITFVIGKPSLFDLLITHNQDIPGGAILAEPSPRYRRRRSGETDSDWADYKAVLVADANAAQYHTIMDKVLKPLAAGAFVNVIVAQGAVNYGDNLFSSVADPDFVLDTLNGLRDHPRVTVMDVKAQDSARVATVLAAPEGQAENPPI